MKRKLQKFRNKSIRLEGYDYSSKGLYFVTICINNRLCLLSNIKNNKIFLKDSGKMVEKYWIKLEKEYDNIKLHNYVIMPNHIHGIIEIKKQNNECNCKICRRNNPCGYSNNTKINPLQNVNNSLNQIKNDLLQNVNNSLNQTKINPLQNVNNSLNQTKNDLLDNSLNNLNNPLFYINFARDNHKGCPYGRYILGHIIGGFKSKTTNEYIKNVKKNNWMIFYKKLWQKNYYEHIIKNNKSYLNIQNYIINNPIKWCEDIFHKKTG